MCCLITMQFSTSNFPGVGHLNSFWAWWGGNLNKIFPNIQMPRGLPWGGVPWSQRFFLISHRMRELRESHEAANTSREAARKKNLWLLWTWISLSCRCQCQDLTLELGLVDIFTNTQINSIGLFDWQYRGDGGHICYCIYLYQRKYCLQDTAVLGLYNRSRFVCVLHWFCSGQCLQRNLTSVLEECFS